MATNAPARVAAVVVGLEGLGLVALTGWQIVAFLAGDTESATSAIALIALTGIGAVVVIAFAFGVWHGSSWGRSGGIVTQALVLAVALGAATGAYAHPLIGLALAVPALAGLVVLVLAARRASASDRAEASGEPPAGER